MWYFTANFLNLLESNEVQKMPVMVQLSNEEKKVDFNFFEEEFQVQLALAISASDPDGREDPETVQIKAAKQLSLVGCSPSSIVSQESRFEFLSLRYWNYNVVNYDERVMDGFYDVYGITSNSTKQGKMPVLVDLQATSISDKIDYEAILVNRAIDPVLQELERTVVLLSAECQVLDLGPVASGLVQKIADLVVNTMGGPVGDAEEMFRRWTIRSYELKSSLKSIVLPLGSLDVGLSRHRALLFKVLADRISLPCRLVKGSYYTGTDEGAVNLIKIDYESEYIIDLMGAPGALIPAEIPSNHLQSSALDVMSSLTFDQTVKESNLALENAVEQPETNIETQVKKSDPDLALVVSSVQDEALNVVSQAKGDESNLVKKNQTEKFEHEFGKLLPTLRRSREGSSGVTGKASPAQKLKVKDVSKYVISAAQNPEFAQKLHAVLLESGASPPPDLFSGITPPQDLTEQNLLVSSCSVEEESKSDGRQNIERSLIPIEDFDFLNQVNPIVRNKNSPEEMTRLQKENVNADFNIYVKKSGSDSSSSEQLLTTSEGFVLVNNNVNVDTCQREVDNASIGDVVRCSQGNAGRMETNPEARGNVSQQIIGPMVNAMEAVNIDPHTASSVHNERINPMLDEVAEWEIPWEDIQIGERIGLGSYGEVYRADWNGTEVAVKKFLDQDLSGDALEQFRCEVRIMLRLRHPNVVLFMGAVTRPPNLSILTEFLPRGSLYRLLHRPNLQIDEKRRLRMALDVVKGMNYLHTSHPTIVHRDLKSPNLLVDKNWVVKVCDFGLSRLKHHTFLSSKSTAGTPEWMAPEVLRNEPSNEKSDVYSFGVILWELTTLRMPWSGMNPMQVVGAVGFQNRRLEIPEDVDPMIAQIISDCWESDPNLRPSFSLLMSKLKRLQRLAAEKT
ncbi:Serine/threonine-protein kinase EDR1 [Thalictrum thalictroides]|uniref:non-specific serine/threonine protein kinase n=1 Tax=Thalictrum thalictroides TaxID=46969 RepID=A0A7J6XFD8_THATH|nr:Serine/threonine-protein kinase EDR1 [Thalictrum thalictroides]